MIWERWNEPVSGVAGGSAVGAVVGDADREVVFRLAASQKKLGHSARHRDGFT
ncbi:hypothetical protein D3C76_1575910 [compost metagenome]